MPAQEDHRLSVRVGSAALTVPELAAAWTGGVIVMDEAGRAPMEVVIDDRVVGLGDLVRQADGALAVRLTSLNAPPDRRAGSPRLRRP